ncbi:hypothetical protein HDU85_006358 [Gaertneriomyces sp. JEL0708]|nr:hypothetical protein HDU85_006358 [Gaertneriomyces sp. JEL0708]
MGLYDEYNSDSDASDMSRSSVGETRRESTTRMLESTSRVLESSSPSPEPSPILPRSILSQQQPPTIRHAVLKPSKLRPPKVEEQSMSDLESEPPSPRSPVGADHQKPLSMPRPKLNTLDRPTRKVLTTGKIDDIELQKGVPNPNGKTSSKQCKDVSSEFAFGSVADFAEAPKEWKFRLGNDYLRLFVLAIITAALSYPLIVGIESLPWRNQKFVDAIISATEAEPYFHSPVYAIFSGVTFIFTLVGFVALQFCVMFGWKLFLRSGMLLVALAISVFIVLSLYGLYRSNMTYYWWYADALVLAVSFVSLCIAFGLLGHSPSAPQSKWLSSQRLKDTLVFTLAEVFVAVFSILYGLWLVPFYNKLTPLWMLFWRVVIFPVYFEIFVLLPSRFLVEYRSKTSGYIAVTHSLTVLHALSHVMTMSAAMISEIHSWQETLYTVALMSLGRFVVRSTVLRRDRVFRRLLGMSEDINASKYLIASEVQLEQYMEMSAAIFTPILMYKLQPLSDVFVFSHRGQITIQQVVITVAAQTVIGGAFDLLFLYLNATSRMRLPFLKTREEVRLIRVRFVIFLMYALLTMGILVMLWVMIRLPRALVCDNADPCSCHYKHAGCPTV